jgi:hypothetical protein
MAPLPAVVPALAGDDLEIQEGTMASVQFYRMVFGDVDAAEKARICRPSSSTASATP